MSHLRSGNYGRLRIFVQILVVVSSVFLLSACTSIRRNQGPVHEIDMNPPSIIQLGDAVYWIVARDIHFKVVVDDRDTTDEVVVPKGFVTDLASTPKFLWGVLPPSEKYMTAAILHDYLYWDQRCSKDQADLMLFLAMKGYRVSVLQRHFVFNGVHLFGGSSFDNNRRRINDGVERFFEPWFVDELLERKMNRSRDLRQLTQDAKIRGGFTKDKSNARIEYICNNVSRAHSIKFLGMHEPSTLDVRNDDVGD